jgi:hypothetical protein
MVVERDAVSSHKFRRAMDAAEATRMEVDDALFLVMIREQMAGPRDGYQEMTNAVWPFVRVHEYVWTMLLNEQGWHRSLMQDGKA